MVHRAKVPAAFNSRLLLSYLLILSLRSGGTISFDVNPTPTRPSLVGSSRLASRGGGGVKLGKAITGASSLSFSSSVSTFYFLYYFLDME